MITRYGMVWPFYGWTMTISYRFLSPIYITIKTINYDKCNYIYIYNIMVSQCFSSIQITTNSGNFISLPSWTLWSLNIAMASKPQSVYDMCFSHFPIENSIYQGLPIGFIFYINHFPLASHFPHLFPYVLIFPIGFPLFMAYLNHFVGALSCCPGLPAPCVRAVHDCHRAVARARPKARRNPW